MKTILIENINRPLQSPLIVSFCDSFFCRLRGLMFQSRLSSDKGLLLVEAGDSRLNASIHMLFVFMDLGVIWIDADNVVVDSVLARAWRPFYAPHRPARYILEIRPERLHEFMAGDRIVFRKD